MKFNKVAIIGVGLIGGSIGMALKKKRLAKEIVGVCRHRSSLRNAARLGAIDKGTLDEIEAVKGADLVIFATPVESIAGLTRKALPVIKRGALLIDVGSTKEKVVKELERILPGSVNFVGAHPLAGSEKIGVRFARADLFEDSTCFLVRTKRTSRESLSAIVGLWRALGAKTVLLSAKRHDGIVAQISHLPHLAAVAIVNVAGKSALKFAASGFRDTTRVAAGEPTMWRDICLTNRAHILCAIDRYVGAMLKIRKAIAGEDAQALTSELVRAKRTRDSL